MAFYLMNFIVAASAVASQLEEFKLLLSSLRVEEGGGVETRDPVHPVSQPVHQLTFPVRHPATLTLSEGGDRLLLSCN